MPCPRTNRKRALFPGDRAAPGCAGGSAGTGPRSRARAPAPTVASAEHDRSSGDQPPRATVVRGHAPCQSHHPHGARQRQRGRRVAQEPHRRPEQRQRHEEAAGGRDRRRRGQPRQRDLGRVGVADAGRAPRVERPEPEAAAAEQRRGGGQPRPGQREQAANDRLVDDVAGGRVQPARQRPRAHVRDREQVRERAAQRARPERVAPDVRGEVGGRRSERDPGQLVVPAEVEPRVEAQLVVGQQQRDAGGDRRAQPRAARRAAQPPATGVARRDQPAASRRPAVRRRARSMRGTRPPAPSRRPGQRRRRRALPRPAPTARRRRTPARRSGTRGRRRSPPRRRPRAPGCTASDWRTRTRRRPATTKTPGRRREQPALNAVDQQRYPPAPAGSPARTRRTGRRCARERGTAS